MFSFFKKKKQGTDWFCDSCGAKIAYEKDHYCGVTCHASLKSRVEGAKEIMKAIHAIDQRGNVWKVKP